MDGVRLGGLCCYGADVFRQTLTLPSRARARAQGHLGQLWVCCTAGCVSYSQGVRGCLKDCIAWVQAGCLMYCRTEDAVTGMTTQVLEQRCIVEAAWLPTGIWAACGPECTKDQPRSDPGPVDKLTKGCPSPPSCLAWRLALSVPLPALRLCVVHSAAGSIWVHVAMLPLAQTVRDRYVETQSVYRNEGCHLHV